MKLCGQFHPIWLYTNWFSYFLVQTCIYFTESDGTPKVRMVYTRAAKGYRMRKVYQPKTYRFRERILKDILKDASKPQPTAPQQVVSICT